MGRRILPLHDIMKSWQQSILEQYNSSFINLRPKKIVFDIWPMCVGEEHSVVHCVPIRTPGPFGEDTSVVPLATLIYQ